MPKPLSGRDGRGLTPQTRRKTMTTETQNDPVKKFRIGYITATVWKNETEEGRNYFSTSIVRSYRGKDSEEWKETNSYSHDDLLNVARLAERAEAFIAKLQS
jgi:hypothetical protein